MTCSISRNELDTRIWDDELDAFVPNRVFDVHTHIYRWRHYLDPGKDGSPYYELIGKNFADADWRALESADRQLLPGRKVDRLAFPFPFPEPCDFEASNDFIGTQLESHTSSGALMLVHPSMSEDYLLEQVRKFGFLGFKPYRVYASTGDAVHCRIMDFIPLHQLRIADRLGLIVMMHLSRPDGLGDPKNIEDLLRINRECPNIRWILAHCGRSYAEWPIRRAGPALAGLSNAWYDTSSVCDPDAIAALCETVGVERVMYGSDDLPIGVLRGKYVTFGHAWAFLSQENHSLDLSHCDGRMTFVRYEQLRAMCSAFRSLNLSTEQIDGVFFDTASKLIAGVRENRPIDQ